MGPGIRVGGGVRENIVVHRAPRAIFTSVSNRAHHAGDFPMPMEQNLNPFLGPTGQHHPDSASLLDLTQCYSSPPKGQYGSYLRAFACAVLAGVYFPRNPHDLLCLVIPISVPMSLPWDTPDHSL